VADLMSTALICVRDTDTMATALREMHRATIHHLPVVDEHLNLVGILSSTDVLDRPGRSPAQRIGRSMSRSVVTVMPETSASRAMEIMTENAFRSLPVVDSDGHLIGILTETDVLRNSRSSSGDPTESAD